MLAVCLTVWWVCCVVQWLLLVSALWDWLWLVVIYRDGSDWLFDELHKHGVPLLIFSAGVGDVVVETVRQRAVLHDNVKVVSNFMDFDSQVLLRLLPFRSFLYSS